MKKKQKLLIYSDCYLYGGSEKLMSFLIKNKLIQESFKIIFVFRKHKIYEDAMNIEYSKEEKRDMLCPITIASNASLFYKIDLLSIPAFIKRMIKIPFYIIDKLGFFFIFNLLIQIKILLKFSPSIIHINNGGYPGASSCNTMVFAAKLINTSPIVYQINNIAFKTKNPISRYFDKYINKNINYFITASKFSKEKLVNYRKFDSEKIILVPNTIIEETATISREKILNTIQIKPTNFVLCNIGFLSKRKGQKYLLEALNLIRDKDPQILEKISLLLVGNGEDETSLKQYSDSLNLKKYVHFLGYQSESINYLNCCDLVVLPSISGEDMPLVILSAMFLGKTIIATDFAGIREEIENNKSGVLISPKTSTLSKMLANKIIELYNHPNNEFGVNAKKRYLQLFSNHIYSKTILNIYNSILN